MTERKSTDFITSVCALKHLKSTVFDFECSSWLFCFYWKYDKHVGVHFTEKNRTQCGCGKEQQAYNIGLFRLDRGEFLHHGNSRALSTKTNPPPTHPPPSYPSPSQIIWSRGVAVQHQTTGPNSGENIKKVAWSLKCLLLRLDSTVTAWKWFTVSEREEKAENTSSGE